MEQTIVDQIVNAASRALATTGPHGVNVVPVSVVDVNDGKVYLYNFFMGKTVENLLQTPVVALTCWSGLAGLQLKATATYITDGALFRAQTAVLAERFPDRTLHGIIELTPTAIFDVSADTEKAGRPLSL